ncbi:hypothetical protein CsSME_00042297 [Camellia sinensis var. sinensis]
MLKCDNAVDRFKRACKIFSVESELLHIWDFSGQTTLFSSYDNKKSAKETQRQPEQETLVRGGCVPNMGSKGLHIMLQCSPERLKGQYRTFCFWLMLPSISLSFKMVNYEARIRTWDMVF